MKHHPFRAGMQRYVRIHRSGRGSHRTPASQIQKQNCRQTAGSRKLPERISGA